MNKSLFMETTKISPERTVGQIQSVLGEYGAEAIMLEYENKEVKSITFKLTVANKEIPFLLPCRYDCIYEYLKERVKKWPVSTEEKINSKIEEIKLQARRIAWRQILRWVEAQLALTDTGMVKMQEVFMPYIRTNSGETIYQQLEEKGFKNIGYQLEDKRP